MNSINGIGTNTPIQKITSQPVHKQVPAGAGKPLPVTDKLELSGLSHLMKALKRNDIRVDKVSAIRAQIEAGIVPELQVEDRLKAGLHAVIADALHRGEDYELITRRVRAYFNQLTTM